MPRLESGQSSEVLFESIFKDLANNPDIRFESDRLFFSERNSITGEIVRTHCVRRGSRRMNPFQARAEATFQAGYHLPVMAEKLIDPSRQGMRYLDGLSNIERLFFDPQDNFFSIDQGIDGVNVDVLVNLKTRETNTRLRLNNASLSTHQLKDRTPKTLNDPEEYWKYKGLTFDSESREFNLILDGWKVIVPEKIDYEPILLKLFPPELRSDKFGAPAESDVWANQDTNYLEEFGVCVIPPTK